MKKILIACSIIIIITINLYAQNNSSKLLGIWKLVKIKESTAKKFIAPIYQMTYQFFDDGNLVVNNNSFRERTYWNWHFTNKGILRLKSKNGDSRFVGKAYFKSKNIFIYKLYFKDKKIYYWIFQKM